MSQETIKAKGRCDVGRLRSAVVALGVAVAIATGPTGVGHAEDAEPARAEELIRLANEQRRQGHDERAVPLLRQAHDVAHSSRTAGQLGLAEMALGYWAAATNHLSEALADKHNPWVGKNRAALQKALDVGESHLAELRIEGEPAGADVIVNGNVVGQFPLTTAVKVSEGRVNVEVRARGRRPATKTLSLAGRAHERLVVVLERDEPQSTADAKTAPSGTTQAGLEAPAIPTDSSANATAEAPATTPPTPAQRPSAPRPAWRRTLAWSLFGGAAVAAGLGVWQHLSAREAQSAFDAIPACGSDDPMRGADGQCARLYSDFESRRTRAYVGYGVAAALAAGAATLLVLDGRDGNGTDESDARHVSLAWAPGGAVVVYGAPF